MNIVKLYKKINKHKVHIYWGLFILITAVTFLILDIYNWVEPCPWCRSERIALIILGICLLIDKEITYYLIAFPIIFFGLDVVFAQLFLHILEHAFPNGVFTILAIMAGYAFLISFYIILCRIFYKYKSKI